MQKLFVVLLSLSFAAFAQSARTSKSSHTGTAKSSGNSDAQFATKAAQGNMAEVALGKLATQNAQSDDVKKFGQRMVDDHGKAEQDLEGIASKDNLTLPKNVSATQKAEQQRLEKLHGAAFDRAYMSMMVKDHQKDVAEFRKEANSTSANADLRDYAKRTYPTLDDHLTNAKAVDNSLTAKAGKSAATSKKKTSSSTGPAGAPGVSLI
jgi:putative membrane protein